MKSIKILTFAAIAAVLLFPTSLTRADDGPQQITFQKCWDDATQSYIGTATGDCGAGDISARFLSVPSGTKVVHFTGEYTVSTSGCSITTVCSGSWIVASGQIVLNGVVTDGPLLGARVHVRAEATDGGACSHGTMTITPN